MKKILLVLIGLMSAINGWAVKANPSPIEVSQVDGTTLTIVLHGDEDFHYFTTLDGILLVQHDGGYYIGAVDAQGVLSATPLLAHNAGERSTEEILQASLQNREAFFARGETNRGILKSTREPIDSTGQHLFPHKGSPRAVVILAEFSDDANHFTIENPKRSFNEYFNAKKPLEDYGRGENRNIVSVRQYFKLASFGHFIPDFDVYGPVTLPSNLATYGSDNSGDGKGERMDLLFQDACSLMNDSLDFSRYDSNNDGYVDLVIIIYAGYSQSMAGNSTDCIWPKSGTISGGTYDGKRVQRYAVSAELNGFPNCWSSAPYERINGIGTLCHEFCHTLGLPDFYPTGNAWKGDNQGMEYWSLMDSGNYLSNGYTPCALNAWEREAMEWMEIVSLDISGEMEIKSIDDGGSAFRINNPKDSREYFVLENIQNIGLNSYQKGHGLLVTHVEYDPNAFSILTGNDVNNIKGHPRMTVVPADGLLFAQYNIDGNTFKYADFYAELEGDPFPGTKDVTELNDTMGVVNYKFYNGGDKTNKALANIYESNEGVVSFNYINNFEDYLGIASYLVLSKNDFTITFYHDNKMDEHQGMVSNLNNYEGLDAETATKVTKVVFDPSFAGVQPTSTDKWFYGMSNLTAIEGMDNLDVSEVTSMQAMFSGCSSIESLDLSHFDTSNVTTMYGMFYGCTSLTSLDLSNFDTSNVTTMRAMFYGCSNLATLNLDSFDTSNVTSMQSMFNGCTKLKSLDLSQFDTSKATNTSSMFGFCSGLESLAISGTMANLNDNACNGVGTKEAPCLITAPEGFHFGVNTNGSFLWKGGWFITHISNYRMGDANHDGIVDVSDVMLTVYKALNKAVADFHMEEADINKDGEIDITDVMSIVNIMLGKAVAGLPTL